MTNHKITSQPWQLKAAAEGTLGAIILPLPEGCVSGSPEDWPIKSMKCGFNESYRIYLAEEWCNFPGRLSTGEPPYYELRSNYPPLVMPSEKEEWQPAETMPEEAAQYWFEVGDVRVVQMSDIDLKEIREAGLFNPLVDDLFSLSSTVETRWNAAHPDYPWDADRWVIVLDLNIIGEPNGRNA
jgi:hypothetical protein